MPLPRTAATAPLVEIRTEMAAGDCMADLVAAAERGPVVQVEYAGGTVWLICDAALARSAYTDPRLSKDPRSAPSWFRDASGLVGSAETSAAANLITSDGAEHTRMRRLHRDMFSSAAVAGWTDHITAVTSGLLDQAEAAGRRIDVVPALAYPLPLTVFCRFLGLPDDVDAVLRAASEDITFAVDPQVRGRGVGTLFQTVARCVHEPDRLHPGFVTSLLALATAEPPEVTMAEVVTWSAGLVLPGHESTASLIASAIHGAVGLPPGRRPRAGDEIEAFVEETLRRHPPFLTPTWRFAATDIELGGVAIPRGAPVLVNIASVNLATETHLSFGHGPHYCLGAALSRLEARIALTRFLQRFPDARLAEDAPAQWQSDIAVRRLACLPVDV